MKIKWTDDDPQTGERRWVRAERFAKAWQFAYRTSRRGVWESGPPPTRVMWEHVLDVLERRYRLRHGVSDAEVAEVKRILAKLPKADEEE
ncbi:MAG TPA: hypothetical protein VH120_18775 [Gemmataceae bacterium]|jgi:type II secretory pathway component PulJ|nr:hypothetical protein [Gemmataceae bacterium]